MLDKPTDSIAPFSCWQYEGDMNPEYGGTWWRTDDTNISETYYVDCVRVIPCSDAGGPDNQFWIEVGAIYIPRDPQSERELIEFSGIDVTDMTPEQIFASLVWSSQAYRGIEPDIIRIIQIGRNDEYSGTQAFNIPIDIYLGNNTDLDGYITAKYLH